jgi:ABC-type Mn2+/Zn2+ transport system ATPase subunit
MREQSLKTIIELDKLEIGYNGIPLISPISLKINEGDFWGVLGHNGAGKSTLVKTMLGLLRPVSGQILFPQGKPRFGYVPQADTIDDIYPVTAREVVELGRSARFGITRRLSAADKKSIEECLAATEATSYADRSFRDLSGGQKQRVLLARALSTDPNILVLDEPISGMDLAGEKSIMDLIRKLDADRNIVTLMITHALSVVANYAEQILYVDKVRRKVLHGPVSEALTSKNLGELYNLPIAVEEICGVKNIFVDVRHNQDRQHDKPEGAHDHKH